MRDETKQDDPVLSRLAHMMDRKGTNRVLTRLRALLRSNEFYLIPLALVVGVVTGAIVTLMSEIAQIAHVLIYGIPIDVRLSANAYVNHIVALIAPAAGGLLLGVMEWSRRRMKISNAVDPIEANALRGGRLSLRDSVVVSGQTLISNGCGASVGLEAGYTQIGSGAASLLGQLLNLRRNDLRLIVGCGAAAAIAAALGAPITGAFYACELIVGVYSVGSAAPILAASLAGSYLNIPVAQLPQQHIISGQVISFYGMYYVVPAVADWPGTVIAVNVGGAVIPGLLSFYLLVRYRLWLLGGLAIVIVAAVCYSLAQPVPGLGIALPVFVPPLSAAVVALILSRPHASALAYIGSSIGCLVGADLLNLGKIQGLGAPVASIGGAGTFDGIFLTGAFAVLLASIFSPSGNLDGKITRATL